MCVCVCVTVCNYLPSIAWACVSARTRTTDCTLLAWAGIHPRLRLPLHRSLLRCLLLWLSVYLSAWQFNCLHSSCCWFLSGFAFTVARLKLPILIVLWPERTRFTRAGFVWISWDLLSLPLPALRFFAFFSFSFTGCLHLSQLTAPRLLAGNEIWLLNDRFSAKGGGLLRVINAIRKQFNISAPRLSKPGLRYLPATPNGTKGNPFSNLLTLPCVCVCVCVWMKSQSQAAFTWEIRNETTLVRLSGTAMGHKLIEQVSQASLRLVSHRIAS